MASSVVSNASRAAAAAATHHWDDVSGRNDERSAATVSRQLRACRDHFRREFGKDVPVCEKCPHLNAKCYTTCGVDMKFRHLRGDFDGNSTHPAGRAVPEADSIGRVLDEINSTESYENRRVDEVDDFRESYRDSNGMMMNLSSGYDQSDD